MLIDLTELILNWFFQTYFLSLKTNFLRQILTAATFCYFIYFQSLHNGLCVFIKKDKRLICLINLYLLAEHYLVLKALTLKITYTWLAITLLLSQSSKEFLPPSPSSRVVAPDSFQIWPFSDELCCYFLSLSNIICLIHPSLPSLYFYTIRSITVVLKVLNKVNFRVLTQT